MLLNNLLCLFIKIKYTVEMKANILKKKKLIPRWTISLHSMKESQNMTTLVLMGKIIAVHLQHGTVKWSRKTSQQKKKMA